MKAKAFEFRLNRVRGIPRILMLVVVTALVIGAAALAVMIGVAVVVVGLAISAVALLGYAVRRALLPGAAVPLSTTHWKAETHSATASESGVIEAEVEVLSIEGKRPDEP